MEIKSEMIKSWEDQVEKGIEKAENTEIMQPFWDENEDSVFQFVMSLMV
ncbi:MAG: hypothetical protein Q4C55_00080 [Eubacterium sp.]|nr:hypothetical protein [Eubacterium sp.]